MMNKTMWVRPNAKLEEFAANEYVAACVVGTVQCMYPGDGSTNGQEVYDDYNGQQSGWYRNPTDGLLHGGCGEDSSISFNGDTASGYEAWNGETQRNRKIYDVSGFKQEVGTYTVTWKSKIDGDSSVYQHKGRLVVDLIDTTHPNRS